MTARPFALALALAAAVALVVLSATARPGADQPTTSPDVMCAEDMACWDCQTMGNRTCGAPNEGN